MSRWDEILLINLMQKKIRYQILDDCVWIRKFKVILKILEWIHKEDKVD